MVEITQYALKGQKLLAQGIALELLPFQGVWAKLAKVQLEIIQYQHFLLRLQAESAFFMPSDELEA